MVVVVVVMVFIRAIVQKTNVYHPDIFIHLSGILGVFFILLLVCCWWWWWAIVH